VQHHPIAFIAGLHRSGTSLVHQILRDHPDVSGFRNTGVPKDEGQHLQTVYPPARSFGGPGRFGFDPASYLDETSPLCTPAHAERLWREWSPHWDLSRPVLLEKSPPNLLRTRYLQRLFPASRFIVVVRNPIVVAMATRKWSRTSPIELIDHWIVCHRKFESDRDHLAHLHVVRYEDLVNRTEDTTAAICRFLDLRRHRITVPVNDGVNDRYFHMWECYLDQNPHAVAGFEKLLSDYLEVAGRYGYSRCRAPQNTGDGTDKREFDQIPPTAR
jgi:hypothetical protein